MVLHVEVGSMPDAPSVSPGTGKELLRATRMFLEQSRIRSWWYVGSTFAMLWVVLISAAVAPWWPVRLAASILGGLLLVRSFVLYHDFAHGAILRGSPVARALFWLYGFVALTPPRSWRDSHNFHHGHVGKPIASDDSEFSLLTSDVGSFPLTTTVMWRRASFWQRLRYRISRHPLTILCAYVTVFFYSLCVTPLLRNPRKYWQNAFSLLAHGGIATLLWTYLGLDVVFYAFWLPFAVAGALGAYLFFAQHNFNGMRIVPIEEWTHYRGALESSSYMKLGPIMRWFTANIGYHHVHHVNSRIPFYRLPEAMAAIPELQQPVVTSLRPRGILACLRLDLWDPEGQRLVSYGMATEPSAKPT